MNKIPAAREFFPRGLFQPAGSFRFAADALLLASFSARLAHLTGGQDGKAGHIQTDRRLLDLGCGCGVVGLGLLLLLPQFQAVGLDRQNELVLAARENAARLGLLERFQGLCLDLQGLTFTSSDLVQLHEPGADFDLITANPPYRLPGSGRLPLGEARRLALFGTADNLRAFIGAAACSLAEHGLFCLIFPLARAAELYRTLNEYGLAPCCRMEIHGKLGAPPTWLLLAAGRADASGRINRQQLCESANLPERLHLYTGNGPDSALTGQAAQFCPFLACNSKK